MEAIVGFWHSSPVVQALMVGGIVFVSGLVVGLISAAIPATIPLWVKALATGVLSGAIIFLLSGGAGGGNPLKEGQETIPDVIEENLNLEATELILDYEFDESDNTFIFILGGQELNMNNWKEDLNQKLEQYENLKTIVVKGVDGIPFNFYKELEKIDKENEDIIFKGLE